MLSNMEMVEFGDISMGDYKIVLAMLAAGALAACGGSGGTVGTGGDSPAPLFSSSELSAVQSLTGSAAPAETGEQHRNRSMALDRTLWETSWTRDFHILSGTFDSGTGYDDIYADLEQRHRTSARGTSAAPSVLTKHDITLFGMRDGSDRSYGSTLKSSQFGVFTTKAQTAGLDYSGIRATSQYLLAISRPSASATWLGLMVAGSRDEDTYGDILQGDAILTFEMSTNEIDTRFNNIVNLDKKAAHSVPFVEFLDVAVNKEGSWRYVTSDNSHYLDADFVEPDHDEAVGRFWTPDMIGSFGAIKQ